MAVPQSRRAEEVASPFEKSKRELVREGFAQKRQLLADENFVTLLRAEDLATMPRPLADLITARDGR